MAVADDASKNYLAIVELELLAMLRREERSRTALFMMALHFDQTERATRCVDECRNAL